MVELHDDALVRRLQFYARLRATDIALVEGFKARISRYERGEQIITAGEKTGSLLIIQQGWAIRYKTLDDGRRQILNVLLPGDMFDLQVLVKAEADHNVEAATPLTLKAVAPDALRAALDSSGTLTMAFWWTQVQEEAFLREQIIRNGRQTARERIGHLLLELHRRARIAGMGTEDGFRLPLTQTAIADMLGLTPIHTNRVLRMFEKDGLIRRDRTWLEFVDADRLAEICQFDPHYFHADASMVAQLMFGD